MNPLGQLPASNSPQFSLNLLDGQKILREVLMLAASGVITVAPMFAGFRYVVHGTDLTPVVLLCVRTAVEAARRFVAGSSLPAPQVPPAH